MDQFGVSFGVMDEVRLCSGLKGYGYMTYVHERCVLTQRVFVLQKELH